MKPMNFSDANSSNVNALTGINIDVKNNCQGCVITFEARCRGIDVTAKGFDYNEFRLLLADDQTQAWRDLNGEHPKLTATFDNKEDAIKFLNGSEMAKNGHYNLAINK